jgi:hypothetical protein
MRHDALQCLKDLYTIVDKVGNAEFPAHRRLVFPPANEANMVGWD